MSLTSFTESLYFILFATGFMIGFGHCIGMCGPIVVSLSLSCKGRNIISPHLLYNAGRITTYTILGGIMGLTGSFTIFVSHMEVIQKTVLIIAGILIVFMGLSMTGWIRSNKIFGCEFNLQGIFAKAFNYLSSSDSSLIYYPAGLMLGLLPCGPVYTALLASAGKGMVAGNTTLGILNGMGMMFAFGLGTVPALILIAKLSDLKWLKKSRDLVYKAGSILMILVGFYFVIQGILY